jgi:hypothetical protein
LDERCGVALPLREAIGAQRCTDQHLGFEIRLPQAVFRE